jgi:hypothetical protein
VEKPMPGMIYHMMIYAKTGKSPALAALNDVAAITGCVMWYETHDRTILEQFSHFLLKNNAEDVCEAMQNHLHVDESMHGPGSPLYPEIAHVGEELSGKEALHAADHEHHARLAELIVETSLDAVASGRNGSLLDMIAESQQGLNIERLSCLFADFFGRDREMFLRGLNLLKIIDPRSITSIDGIAGPWLAIRRSAMANLSHLQPEETFKPWYEYLTRCFSTDGIMNTLRRLESGVKIKLESQYEDIHRPPSRLSQ